MAVVTGALLPVGTRVKIRRSNFPLDPALVGRTGTIIISNDYRPNAYAVLLDGETETRVVGRAEVEPTEARALVPPREEAKRRRALP
jgi:hypothetical protein